MSRIFIKAPAGGQVVPYREVVAKAMVESVNWRRPAGDLQIEIVSAMYPD